MNKMSSGTKQLLSIILSLAVYAFYLNWKISLLLVVSIAFHEQCHLLAAKKMGLSTNRFYLIPFLGGVALITGKIKRYSQDAFVSLMGPVGGGALAMLTAGLWFITGWTWLAAAASFMCLINVFNLMPLSFMDGGRVLNSICYSINKTFGMVIYSLSTLVACVGIYYLNPMVALMIIMFGGPAVLKEINNWRFYREGKAWLCTDDYLHAPKPLTYKQMALTLAGWFATAGILLQTMLYLNTQLPHH
jgi:Zn-dependent protease